MIPGLEYEPADGGGGASSSSAVNAYQQQQQYTQNSSPTQLHRRRNATTNGNGYNNSSGSSGGNYENDNKYNKPHSSIPRAVRKLDIFPKAEKDYTVRTERGGQLTAIGYVLMSVLIVAEWMTWRGMNGISWEHIVVDTSLGKRMRVNLNITFPSLHCDDLHLDVIDTAGDSQLNLSDKMFKQRLMFDGTTLKPIGIQKIAAEANIKAEEDRKRREALEKQIAPDYCGPCYGAHETETDCCNTCDSVLEAYKRKHWNDMAVQSMSEQCIREGRSTYTPKKMSRGEGCNLSGYFTVNRVAGNFHIAMGEGVDRDGRHIHHFLPEDRVNFNASHVVHELSFMDEEYADAIAGGGGSSEGGKEVKKGGGIINGEKSMNGIHKTTTEELGTTGLFQYFIKIVPTRYKGNIVDSLGSPSSQRREGGKDNNNKIVETNRYFYTERFRPLIGEVHEEAILRGDPDFGTAGAHVGGKTGGTLHEKMEHHDKENAVLPGIFFIYEIYPFAVEITKNRVPFVHLLMRVMATVGGVFTIMSLIDGVLYSREKKGRG